MDRKEIALEDKWDLSTLFNSDEDFEIALKEVQKEMKSLGKYAGYLNEVASLKEYFDLYYEVEGKLDNVFTYASLRESEDTRQAKASDMYARAYGAYVELVSLVSYVQPELLSLSESELESLMKDEDLKKYHFILEKMAREKAHTLSEKEESILASLQEVLSASSQISSKLMDADMKFDSILDKDGNLHELNASNYILYQTSPDRVLRENSFRSFYKSFKQFNNTLAQTYSTCVTSATGVAKLRHFDSSLKASLYNDAIPQTVYDQLIETIHEYMPVMYRYVALRKKILGLDELHYYDLYTPLSELEMQYDLNQAKEMVVEAVLPLGKDYQDIVRQAFKDRWMDAYPNDGKHSGAFSSGTRTSNPFILTNFSKTLDSVSTIAHEMGHSMHTYFTSHTQEQPYANYSLFIAEVASTVNENLLIEQLLDKETDLKKRLHLLNQYLEGFKGTIYRQTMFAEFEKEAHAHREQGQALTTEYLNDLYEGLVKEYFGDELVMDPEVKYEWSRIPHFYRPFYVYVYATGYSSAIAISEKLRLGSQEDRDNYRHFLSVGSSVYPLEALKIGGVDLNTREPIRLALEKFKSIVEEAEKIVEKL
ncbi:oligoendopeptidase F [Bulleidia sp. zg-1006]|uniref:oligoendopeptidase F n=1 Tax=Bulleidia sp. zg-1006 TaxID=2806552 RepID=UPI00193A55B7|nr:oligoendopeptidase F [Bulleidia sp. zg-1006]QRG87272.1 oligoendopeptidase F [Bulleidia sp. zg-1006]